MAEPKRMCLITRKMLPKSELIRIVKVNDKIIVDEKQKIQSRGFYVSKDLEALKDFKKKKVLNKAFKMEVAEKVYDEVILLCQNLK